MFKDRISIQLLVLTIFAVASTSGFSNKEGKNNDSLDDNSTDIMLSKPTTGETIDWDVLDGGGGLRSSGTYAFSGSIGQSATGRCESGSYILWGGYASGIGEPPYFEPVCSKEGDPAFYADFGEDSRDMIAGETYCWTISAANFGFVSATCPDTDTFCVHAWDTQGWTVHGDPPLGQCFILNSGYFYWQDVYLTVPCTAVPCDYDTLYATMAYCDVEGICAPSCGDCENPNWYGGNPYYSTDAVVIHIVESPPALCILQDSLYEIWQGQTAAYVPFSICNGDPCPSSVTYDYCIESTGHIGAGFPQCSSTSGVPGGECEDVYGIVDASAALVCDLDTLTIVVWDQATGTEYDTCVQIVHVIEPKPVPLLTTPVMTVLVVALILAAAAIIRRKVISKA